MGVAPFFGIHTCSTQTLAPSGAHAPVCPQEKGASRKTGCDTHWVPDIGTSGACLPVFCALKCVYPKTPIGCQTLAPSGAHAPVGSQKKGASEKTGCDTHWVPDIGTQWRACTCFFGFTMCVSQKNGVTPIRCQTLAPSGAHAPVCPRKRGASKMSWRKFNVVSCHIVANVEIGWHATLLTNGSNMDMVKMSVVDKSLKCGK